MKAMMKLSWIGLLLTDPDRKVKTNKESETDLLKSGYGTLYQFAVKAWDVYR